MADSVNNKETQQKPQKQQPGKKEKVQELSEEDQQKKAELDMLVERAKDVEPGVAKMALENLAREIREATSSMTAIPKPLKFLKDHYPSIETFYETMEESENKKLLADILSMLAMVMAPEGSRKSLRYKLEGNPSELGSWGHEYVRNISGEVGQEYQERLDNEQSVDDLLQLVDLIVPFFIKSNAEADACDLLIEVEQLDKIIEYCDETNFSRVCQYLLSCAYYVPEPEDSHMLQVCYTVYKNLRQFPLALRVALRLNDMALTQEIFSSCDDPLVQKQMAFMLARQKVYFNTEDDEVNAIMGNNRLHDLFVYLADDLDSLEPKTPEDIYKSHLTETRSALAANVDSARQNLASSFVNGMVNAGFGTDKLLLEKESDWIYRNRDYGAIATAASVGLLFLWDENGALAEIDKYIKSRDTNVKAGGLIAAGIFNAGLRTEIDSALALLKEHVEGSVRDVRISAIMGLGIAYAGSSHEEVLEVLMPILLDGEQPYEVVCMTALSLGLVFMGTCHEEIAANVLQVLSERDDKTLEGPLTRHLTLGLGLLFLNKQEAAEAILETSKALLGENIGKLCEITIMTCAYAGTGDVLKVQQLLAICGEHPEEGQPTRHQPVAVLGIALIAMGEEIGTEMAMRSFEHLLQYGDIHVKRAVPLALGLLNVSNPKLTVMDTLSKLSHDSDAEVAQSAILALGFLGAGSNHARIAQLLRTLAVYYNKDPNALFCVRLAQGLLFLGKGLLTLSPIHSDRMLLSFVSLAGLMVTMHSCLELKDLILGKYPYLLYFMSCAMYPRMLITVDEELNPFATSVRVGTAVDTVAQAGKPRRITGFQTHNSPVLLNYEERAEFATEEFLGLSSVLEGVVICKKNPEYTEE